MNFNEISIKTPHFFHKSMHYKVLSAKSWQLFAQNSTCLALLFWLITLTKCVFLSPTGPWWCHKVSWHFVNISSTSHRSQWTSRTHRQQQSWPPAAPGVHWARPERGGCSWTCRPGSWGSRLRDPPTWASPGRNCPNWYASGRGSDRKGVNAFYWRYQQFRSLTCQDTKCMCWNLIKC